jgi:hypothetical protein
MYHKALADLQQNIAVFESVAAELETHGFELNDGGTHQQPYGESYDFHMGWIDGDDPDENDRVGFGLWLFVDEGNAFPPRVALSMMFGEGMGPSVHVEHCSNAWRLSAEKEGTRKSPRCAKLLGLLDLKLDEDRKVSPEEALNAIRILAKFYNDTKSAFEAKKQAVT